MAVRGSCVAAPVMVEIPDGADPAAMCQRGSNEGGPSTGKVHSGFSSPGSSEVHGVAATHKVLSHGGRCQDPADP